MEICIPKSHVVWPVSTASYVTQHAHMIQTESYWAIQQLQNTGRVCRMFRLKSLCQLLTKALEPKHPANPSMFWSCSNAQQLPVRMLSTQLWAIFKSCMHAISWGIAMYPLEEQVLWLAEDSAGIKHHIQIEHTYLYFNFAYSVHNQAIQYQVQFSWSYLASYKGFWNANPQRNEMGQSSQHSLCQACKYIVRLTKPVMGETLHWIINWLCWCARLSKEESVYNQNSACLITFMTQTDTTHTFPVTTTAHKPTR